MVKSLHIAGTGSFAAEIAGWVAEAGIEVGGLIELQDRARVGSNVHGLPVVALDGPPPEGTAILGLGGDRRRTGGCWQGRAGCREA